MLLDTLLEDLEIEYAAYMQLEIARGLVKGVQSPLAELSSLTDSAMVTKVLALR